MISGRWHSGMTTHRKFWPEASWNGDSWYDQQQAYWNEWTYDDEEWNASNWNAPAQWDANLAGAPARSVDEKEDNLDPALAEALEAEKAAESLTMEARRTWSQAQQATQQLRKDRGLGSRVHQCHLALDVTFVVDLISKASVSLVCLVPTAWVGMTASWSMKAPCSVFQTHELPSKVFS